jgi:hypothetical protein
MSGSDHLVPALGASSAFSMPKAPTKPPPLIVKPFRWSSRSAFDDTWPTLPTVEPLPERVRVGSVPNGSEAFQA